MVKIIIENLGQKEVTGTALNKTALQLLHGNFVDWMHECGGKGRCTTCKMIIMKGEEHLGALTEPEMRYRKQHLLKDGERLACQAKVMGEIRVSVPEESKLPHLRYSG